MLPSAHNPFTLLRVRRSKKHASRILKLSLPFMVAAWAFCWATLMAQTPSPILQSGVLNQSHYLMNSSWQYDTPDYSGLPWTFYYGNAAMEPPSGQRRLSTSSCQLSRVDSTPYGGLPSGATYFDWFSYPVVGGEPSSNGDYPFAPPGEFLESAYFAGSKGFDFQGEFGGVPFSPTPGGFSSFVEAVFFTDRRCFDAGVEYGWYRFPANGYYGDQPVDSVTFYYSIFTNCNLDYACYDTNGWQVFQSTAEVKLTGIPTNNQGTRNYIFRTVRDTATNAFLIRLIDPQTGSSPGSACGTPIPNGTDSVTTLDNCSYRVPIASWYPSNAVTENGYVFAGTQTSRTSPPNGPSAPPPTNLSGLDGLTATGAWALY